MVFSTTTHHKIPYLSQSSTKYHGFNHISSGSLFPIGQDCNHNFTAVFENNSVKIFKSTEVNINTLCPPIIQGHRNAPSKPLYSVFLPTYPLSTHKENASINVSSFIFTMAPYSLQIFNLVQSN